MRFYRIYIEITNGCGLHCSFCPSSSSSTEVISLSLFESIVSQAQNYTKEIACHVLGDPLTLSTLQAYLDILEKYQMKALLTTSGYYLKKHSYDTLFHPAVKQINISLNSYNKNETTLTLEQYISPIVQLCEEKLKQDANLFINLRLWNIDESMSDKEFNQTLFSYLSRFFTLDYSIEDIYKQRPKSIRLDNKILLHFDNYFEWPSMNNPLYGHGTCQGLSSHIAILANGTVVPCCLDSDGVMALGDLTIDTLDEVIKSKKSKSIIKGFKEGKAVEELCQRCSYKDRFDINR